MDSVSVPSNKPMSSPVESPEPSNGKNELFSTVAILLLAPIIAFLLTFFIFQSYEVDGPSMETTLQDQDRLIVVKTPRTWAKITGHPYIPERYTVVVFNHNGSFGASGSQEKQLIKRIIGLPGDRVVVKDGVVTIYNAENPDGFLPDREGPQKEVIKTTDGNLDTTIKGGELFAMGDNREDSLDSRNFGTVKAKDIVGHLSLRIYPLNKIEKF